MCNKTETLTHLFYGCEKIHGFWESTTKNYLEPYGICEINKENVILGFDTKEKQNNIINHIILEAKYFIYVCKLEKKVPVFNRFKNRLKITESIERQIAFKNNQMEKHEYKWHHLLNYIID